MGLYYQPPPPHIGAAQPLEPKKLTPPQSGPPPSNPIFGAASLAATLISAWTAVAAPLPQANLGVAVFAAAPATTLPPRAQPALVEIQDAWAPVPWFQPGPPKLTASAPQAPPLRTWSVPTEVLVGWIPPPPQPLAAINLNPPISGPTPQAPPVRLWSVPGEILITWIPPPPPPPVAIHLNPPIAGPTPQSPPTRLWSVPGEVLIGWIPPPPQAPVAVNLNPPIAGPAPQAPPVRTWSVPGEILIGWLSPPPAPIVVGPNPPAGVVPAVLVPRSQPALVEVQVSWLPLPWPQPAGPKLTASGPAAPQPPPIRVWSVPSEILIGWLPPQPQPIVAINLKPPIAGPAPQAPPLLIGNPALAVWQPITWTPQIRVVAVPQQASAFLPISPSLVATLDAWQPVPWAFPAQVRLTASGPVPQAPPRRIISVPGEVLIGWLPPPPAPIIAGHNPPPRGPVTVLVPHAQLGAVEIQVAWLPLSWAQPPRLRFPESAPPAPPAPPAPLLFTLPNGRWRSVASSGETAVPDRNYLSPMIGEVGFTLYLNTELFESPQFAAMKLVFVKPSGRRLTISYPVFFGNIDPVAGNLSLQRGFVRYIFGPGDLDEAGLWAVWLELRSSRASGIAYFQVLTPVQAIN